MHALPGNAHASIRKFVCGLVRGPSSSSRLFSTGGRKHPCGRSLKCLRSAPARCHRRTVPLHTSYNMPQTQVCLLGLVPGVGMSKWGLFALGAIICQGRGKSCLRGVEPIRAQIEACSVPAMHSSIIQPANPQRWSGPPPAGREMARRPDAALREARLRGGPDGAARRAHGAQQRRGR